MHVNLHLSIDEAVERGIRAVMFVGNAAADRLAGLAANADRVSSGGGSHVAFAEWKAELVWRRPLHNCRILVGGLVQRDERKSISPRPLTAVALAGQHSPRDGGKSCSRCPGVVVA
jgi:hypothetical protein